MDNDFKELQSKWKNNKKDIERSTNNINQIYMKISTKKRDNYVFYYSTIVILVITLIVISLFFYFVAPVQVLLSRIGAALMIVGLFFRIIIEIISIFKLKRINLLDNTLKVTNNTISFYRIRKTIQKVIAPIVVGLYTIGFYMITPEFSIYIDFWLLLIIDVSYLVIAFFLFVFIRKGIKKEMETLLEIINLRKELIE